jgi:hypothetical protein
MSVIFTVTPVLAGLAWPLLVSLISKTLNQAGYSAVEAEAAEREKGKALTEVDLELKNSEGLGETMGIEEKLVMRKDDITLTFTKGGDNSCKVHVSGAGRSKDQLFRAGQEAANRVVQAYTYHKVVEEAKKKGLQLVAEEQKDGRIKLRFRKWD